MKVVVMTWDNGRPVDLEAWDAPDAETGIRMLEAIGRDPKYNVNFAARLENAAGMRLATLNIFRPGRDREGRTWSIDRTRLVEL